jgi:hypothetical protein
MINNRDNNNRDTSHHVLFLTNQISIKNRTSIEIIASLNSNYALLTKDLMGCVKEVLLLHKVMTVMDKCDL